MCAFSKLQNRAVHLGRLGIPYFVLNDALSCKRPAENRLLASRGYAYSYVIMEAGKCLSQWHANVLIFVFERFMLTHKYQLLNNDWGIYLVLPLARILRVLEKELSGKVYKATPRVV